MSIKLIQKMANLESHPHSPTSSSAIPHTAFPSNPYCIKLEVSHFDGSDPLVWIFKITQFFEYQSTPNHERLTIASFYMDNHALTWFQWMASNSQLVSCSVLLQALQACFVSSQYDNPTGALFKLTQRDTVNTYLPKFKALTNQIIGLPPPFLLSCFISYLVSKIHRECKRYNPSALVQASRLAKLQREKFNDFCCSFRNRLLFPPHFSSITWFFLHSNCFFTIVTFFS